jgi:hypothetical protein
VKIIAKSVVEGQLDVTLSTRPTATDKIEYTVTFGSVYETFNKADAVFHYIANVEMQCSLLCD